MEDKHERRLSRRRFLGTVGASAGAAALSPGGAAAAREPSQAALGPVPAPGAPTGHCRPSLAAEHFGRIFRLPPFAPHTPEVEGALRELGKPGGLLDAADPLAAGPKALIVDLSLSANNPNNPNHTAGTTFFGQFLDHDVTFDAGSRLAQATDPEQARNFRSPALDLDSVYGAGPVAQQELYDAVDHVKLKVESGGLFEDLPRRADGAAIVGDPRNDENLIVAGMHCAFLRFHNQAVDHVRAEGRITDTAGVFAEARRLTTWHYHWLIVNEFLPQVAGQDLVGQVLRRGRRLYRPRRGGAFIPVEFQTGTYRMGHSMVRPSYRANLAGDDGQPFFAFVFDPSQEGRPDPDDLRGGSRAARRFIGWQTFFDFGDGRGQAEQEDRHQDLDGAVQPAARRDRQPRPAHRAAPAQPAAPPDLAAPLGPGRRARDGSRAARARRPAGARVPRRRLRAQHAALVLRPQGGRDRRRRAATSGRSAAASSPRCSSACCSPIRARTSRRNRVGSRRSPRRAARSA